MNKMLLILLSSVILLSSCAKKSEYYIKPPNPKNFNVSSVNKLSDSDVELIKEFIPEVINWYNSIDITEPLPLDFVSDDVDNLGKKLCENKEFLIMSDLKNINEVSKEEKERYSQISPVIHVYGQILGILVTSDYEFVLAGKQRDPTITVKEKDWVELGNDIKKFIDYYYKN